MKIINKTNYDTKVLRKIFSVALRLNEESEGKYLKKQREEILVTYSIKKHKYPSGLATINGSWMKIKIPKDYKDVKIVAWIFEHELYHNRGYRHRKYPKFFKIYPDFDRAPNNYLPKIEFEDRYKELNGLNLVEKQEKQQIKTIKFKQEKPKQTIREIRYNRVIVKVEEIKRKIRRYENMLKKYEYKKKYYERSLAATQNK